MNLQQIGAEGGASHKIHGHGSREHADGDKVAAALAKFRPHGDVLELTFGARKWTNRILLHANRVTTVDLARNLLPLRGVRVDDPRARFIQADLRTWAPDERYNVVFVSFWLSHVVRESFSSLWSHIRHCLLPHGRVFLVHDTSSPIGEAGQPALPTRELEEQLRSLGWRIALTPISVERSTFWGAGTIEDIW